MFLTLAGSCCQWSEGSQSPSPRPSARTPSQSCPGCSPLPAPWSTPWIPTDPDTNTQDVMWPQHCQEAARRRGNLTPPGWFYRGRSTPEQHWRSSWSWPPLITDVLRDNICGCVEINHKCSCGSEETALAEKKRSWKEAKGICGTAKWCWMNNEPAPLTHHTDATCFFSTRRDSDCGDTESEEPQRCEIVNERRSERSSERLLSSRRRGKTDTLTVAMTFSTRKGGYSKDCCVWSTGSVRGRGWAAASSQHPLLSSSGWAWSDQSHSCPCPPCSYDRSAPGSKNVSEKRTHRVIIKQSSTRWMWFYQTASIWFYSLSSLFRLCKDTFEAASVTE